MPVVPVDPVFNAKMEEGVPPLRQEKQPEHLHNANTRDLPYVKKKTVAERLDEQSADLPLVAMDSVFNAKMQEGVPSLRQEKPPQNLSDMNTRDLEIAKPKKRSKTDPNKMPPMMSDGGPMGLPPRMNNQPGKVTMHGGASPRRASPRRV